MSSTPSPSSKGQQRTRNAQAQADLRARRKAYIKSLEDTVSSLEACVRSLCAQNSDLISSSSSSSSSFSSSCKDTGSSSSMICDEVERLKGENARLHTMLAEAGLSAAAATRLAKMGKDSPLHETRDKLEAEAKTGKAEAENWSNTSSITTKKRKLTKMQAYAKDVDSQIHSLPSSSTPLLSSAAVEAQSSLAAFEGGVTPCEHPDQQAIHAYMTSTPSASSSSRASVVSHRSPRTPRFDAVETPPRKTDFSFDPTQGLSSTHIERPWSPSIDPTTSVSFSQFAAPPGPPPPPPPQQQQPFIPPPQILHQTELLTTWLDHQLSPHWPASTPTTIPSSSASISDARSPLPSLLRHFSIRGKRWAEKGIRMQSLEPAILV